MNDDTPTRRVASANAGAASEPQPGQRLFGRYLLEGIAGRGGMGVVWRARDEELGDTVALKFLPGIVAVDPAALDELKEETRRARRLTHPHIVRIYDFVRDETMAAVSMEYVSGATLAQRRLEQPGKVFATETLAPLVVQLCAALDYAHLEAKVVHRDLKPANLLVTDDGRLKVTDFGIARSLSETHTRLTGRAGANSGTLLYMSPQQLTGNRPTALDDIYAVGATLYELLCSKSPFYSGDITHQILNKAPVAPSQQRRELGVASVALPPAWERAILRCLDKDAAKRPQSGAEIVRLLGLGTPATTAKLPGPGTPKAQAPSSLQYPTGGKKWEDLETPAVSSIHYPNPDRPKGARRRAWVDLLVIGALLGAGTVYFLGLTPLPRPWIEQAAPAGNENAPENTAAKPPATHGQENSPAPAKAAVTAENPLAPIKVPAPRQANTLVSAGTKAGPASTAPAVAAVPATAGGPSGNAPASARAEKPAAPTPATGSVRLTVVPATARARLDDDIAERMLPLDLSAVAAGHHVLTLRAAGHLEKRVEFEVSRGQVLDLGTIRLATGTGSLFIDSEPSFIQFELKDDVGKISRGVTPWDDDKLQAGFYTLTFVRPGNADMVKQIQIEEKGVLRVMANFSGGTANFTMRGGAAEARPAERASPAATPVEAFTTANPIVPAAPVKPRPTTGRLRLEVTGPENYLLYVNDRLTFSPAGERDGLELPAGDGLKIEVRAPGYQSAVRQVTVPAGGSIGLSVTLDRIPAPEPVAAVSPPPLTDPAVNPNRLDPESDGGARRSRKAPPAEEVRVKPRLLESVAPVYPTAVRAEGIKGVVTVRLNILTNGRAEFVNAVSSPDPRLTESVRNALRQFRFEPAKLNGRPVEQTVTMDFEFQM